MPERDQPELAGTRNESLALRDPKEPRSVGRCPFFHDARDPRKVIAKEREPFGLAACGVEGGPERSPDSCRTNQGNMKKPREVVRRLAGIATRLWLASPCDRDLTIAAAAKVVAKNEEKIRRYLEAASTDQQHKKL